MPVGAVQAAGRTGGAGGGLGCAAEVSLCGAGGGVGNAAGRAGGGAGHRGGPGGLRVCVCAREKPGRASAYPVKVAATYPYFVLPSSKASVSHMLVH
eukprot:1161456-Pelagomonas_calceolata.AAC.1